MIRTTINILFYLSFLGFVACTQRIDSNKVLLMLPDTSLTHRDVDMGYLKAQQIRRHLNLKDLRLGVDSFELRIYESGMWTPEKLYIVKKEDSTWTCSIYYYWARCTLFDGNEKYPMSYIDMISHTVIDSCEFKNVIPKYGWNNFADSLNSFSPFSFISQREIPKFNDRVNDGTSFSFEIATHNKYKYFSYHCPDAYIDKDNVRATQLLWFIGRHLDPIWLCGL